ncbi:MAG: hypothetical protein KA713_00485 [Chryseotalea sp. WA131a]|nr:MAG: hypothetical protein KA713_00485 [Chryseotalea sp. WA131a]
MQSLSFWKNWPRPYQYIFWLFSAIAFVSVGLLWFTYFQDAAFVFPWLTMQQLEAIDSTARTFSVGSFAINVPSNSLVLFEALIGGDYHPVNFFYYFFLVCLTLGIFTLLTIISTLKRFSFFIGMSLLILCVISFNLETLQLFGLTNKIATISILVLLCGTAFYFQSFRTETTFAVRLVTFLAIGLLLALTFAVGSQVANPFLHLAVNGITAGMVLGIVFILLVAHEIVASFIDIVTQTKNPSKSAQHFYVLSAIYFINLFLSYLIKEGYLNIPFWVINSFLLLTISAVLGIWGFNRREPLYRDFLSSPALAVFACLGLMAICFSVCALFIATGNTTMTETFVDITLYAHMGYGLIFIVYVTANFSPMLLANLPVYKILYKPDTMLFFTFRFGAAIAAFAFLSFASTWGAYVNQAYAAYYNAHGDLYWGQGDLVAAEGYYKKSVVYRNQNLHAHYALGALYTRQLDPAKARYELASACENSPSEMAFINLGELYGANGNHLSTSLIMREGIKKFPQSARLLNAQGLSYVKLGRQDSALVFFEKSRAAGEMKEMAETNLLAASAKFSFSFPADSLLALLKSDKESAKSNALALANVQQLPLSITYQLPIDTTLSVKQAVLLINYLHNQLSRIDTTMLSQAISLAHKSSNETFKHELLMAVASCYYEKGMTKLAGEIGREVAYGTANGKYFHLLGVWLLEQENPATAARYFKIAAEKSIANALWYQALSWLEADSIQKAMPLLTELANQPDTIQAKKAFQLGRILNLTATEVPKENETNISTYLRYRVKLTDTLTFNRLLDKLQTPDLRAASLLARSKKYFTQDQIDQSVKLLQRIKGLPLTDKKIYEQIQHFSLQLTAKLENWNALKPQMANVHFEGRPNNKIYFEALVAEAEGNLAEAAKKFDYLSRATVQDEEIALGAARYFLRDSTDRLKPYSIILNGLLAKPNSIKLLKVYVKEAAILGFDEESEQALEKLKKLLSPIAFNQYVRENPDFFEVSREISHN